MTSPRLAVVLCLVTALSVFTGSTQAAQDSSELHLDIGEQRVISSAGVSSYSEGTRGIVDIRLTKDAASFVLVGVRAGSTTLLFLMNDGREQLYRISVGNVADPARSPSAIDPLLVPARDNIRLDVYFVQLTQSYNHRLGIGWPSALRAPVLSSSFDLLDGNFTGATAVVSNQTLPMLDMAQATGWAKLLRQAAVVTTNGTEAKFAGGGEINVAVTAGLGAALRQINFGSEISVLPRYDRSSGRLELSIHADISDLAPDHGTGIPGRITSNLDSVINLALGQSVVLAGLTARSESSSQTGLPLLSQIPIVGALFGTNTKQEESSDNVIVIVPSVIDATTLQARRQVESALSDYEKFSGDLARTQTTRTFLDLGRKQRPSATAVSGPEPAFP